MDLAFGRFGILVKHCLTADTLSSIDTSAHPLADHLSNTDPNAPPSHTHCIWPGKDYYNPTFGLGMGDILHLCIHDMLLTLHKHYAPI